MPTAAQVSATWRDPPPEYGPEPYFDMSGAVDQAEVERDLDEMKALGFRAVTPQAGVNLPFEYLSEDYFKFFQMLSRKRRNATCASGSWTTSATPAGLPAEDSRARSPNCACRRWEWLSGLRLRAAELRHAVSQDTVAVTAIGDDHSTIAVPVRDGSIDWTAPAGKMAGARD